METGKLLKAVADSVLNMDEEGAAKYSKEALDAGIDPMTIINEGLIVGMNQAGKLFEENQYFVPELLLCSDAMYAGLNVVTPHIKKEENLYLGSVVIGVVEGDTHDIGKNLVKVMLQASGFRVYDLGRDVPAKAFVDKVREVGADLLCLSTLMTSTMDEMKKVIDLLEKENIRERVKVLVGGGPISSSFARSIGADGYGENATGAVRVAKKLLGIMQAKSL
ncbi:corrinoid protein [Thermosediminibacter litoriperuensis]|uniref:Corrinoid protein of di/trimethylamine methyltransferase n=1 Tax=Thermosediminibacter litoriperuensis TaxID=291989 RepID=A0A5S5AWA9_9FIRM|nr:corrinoid protein [Thermosediminibacter litoriperuensis]TYP57648.1 corrinoid protein of di/trimethylamine methyltransferase [Thermosediminibacter litoriperuensis]